MTKKRSGSQTDDLFRKSTEIGKMPEKNTEVEESVVAYVTKQGRGRPAGTESWRRVTVVLYDRQIVSLDKLSTAIREESRAAISRAEIIRGVLDAFLESGGDFSHVQSEYELKEAVLERLEE